MTDLPLLLVVDDDEAIPDIVRAAGEDHFRIETARDGYEGLRLIRLLRPNAVILDLDMPRMDGRTVLRMVRRDPDLAGIVIAVVTASSASDVLGSVAELGCDLFFEKPISPRGVVAQLLERVRPKAPAAPAPAAPAPAPAPAMSGDDAEDAEDDARGADLARSAELLFDPRVQREVLLIDRDDGREEVRAHLARIAGLHLREVDSSAAALERARTAAVDLVILGLSFGAGHGEGLTLLEELRRMPSTAEVPALVTATAYDEDDLDRAFNLGVHSFLVRPLKGSDLVYAVGGALRQPTLSGPRP